MFTEKDYLSAIRKLKRGMAQLQPNGYPCFICGDTGHQAWECHHNPLVAVELAGKYQCYHCGRIFSEEDAEEHFGKSEDEVARCLQPAPSGPPVEEGWYWFGNADDGIWEIVRLWKERNGLSTIHDGRIYPIKEWQGQWSGPIKEPS